jgi:hypothetical protein
MIHADSPSMNLVSAKTPNYMYFINFNETTHKPWNFHDGNWNSFGQKKPLSANFFFRRSKTFWSYVVKRIFGTNIGWFRCSLKPRKFKSGDMEHVHSLLVLVFNTTNSRIHGTMHLTETTVGLPNNSYKPITNTSWVRAQLFKLGKRCTRLAAASDKVYQLFAHAR